MNFKNWKTTSTGLLSILGGILIIVKGDGSTETIMAGATAIMGGIGLVFAKDGTTTGVGEDAKTLQDINKEK